MGDNSLWKIVFGFMLVVALLVFFGTLGMSDTDIFNIERARAQAAQIESQTAYNAQRGQIDLSIYPQLAWERNQAQIRLIQAQTQLDAAAIAEQERVMRAENDRVLAGRARYDAVKIWFGVFAAGGLLVVGFYVLLRVAHRAVDRLLPPRPPARPPAPPPAPPPGDVWNDPDFRSGMRRLARQLEIAERLAGAPPADGA